MKRFCAATLLTILMLALFSCSDEPPKKPKIPSLPPMGEDGSATILLDAGHGFRDVGCTSEYLGGVYEYELTMDFTKKLAEKLRTLGYTVLLTHNGVNLPSIAEMIQKADVLGVESNAAKLSPENNFFDAYERAIWANVKGKETEIDLFLSIHVNASADSDTATGFEIDYCAENSASSMSEFAFSSICDAIEQKYPDRRFKQFADSWDMSFIVTKYTSMPSILFETGFASTPSDAHLLLDELWRDSLMSAMAEGIAGYFALDYEK